MKFIKKSLLGLGALAAVGLISGALYAKDPSDIHCLTSVGKTGGWLECTGKGTWRGKADCAYEGDRYTRWVTQGKGPHREYLNCTFKMRNISYEVRNN
jgi:hypothetical protein